MIDKSLKKAAVYEIRKLNFWESSSDAFRELELLTLPCLCVLYAILINLWSLL